MPQNTFDWRAEAPIGINFYILLDQTLTTGESFIYNGYHLQETPLSIQTYLCLRCEKLSTGDWSCFILLLISLKFLLHENKYPKASFLQLDLGNGGRTILPLMVDWMRTKPILISQSLNRLKSVTEINLQIGRSSRFPTCSHIAWVLSKQVPGIHRKT